ncbi:MAG TPA: RNA polymerase sigma factor [Pirellulales bacterium]|nr:RNA polymerase sigma factor [Pirellulales bacterium]
MTERTPQSEAENRLNRWVREYAPGLFGFLMVTVRDRHRAEDLLQEVFCRAWEARGRYTESGLERAYLWRIADRAARDYLRVRRRETPVDDAAWSQLEPTDAGETDPSAMLRQAELKKQLSSAMEALSEPQRRAVLLRYYGHLEFHEIAAVLDCPLNTALSHVRRGLAVLRRVLVEMP